jgi:hypothetical protein
MSTLGIFKISEKVVVGTLCTYEVVAILSNGHVPTLTEWTRRKQFVAPSILAGLLVHFYLEDRWVSTMTKRSATTPGRS